MPVKARLCGRNEDKPGRLSGRRFCDGTLSEPRRCEKPPSAMRVVVPDKRLHRVRQRLRNNERSKLCLPHESWFSGSQPHRLFCKENQVLALRKKYPVHCSAARLHSPPGDSNWTEQSSARTRKSKYRFTASPNGAGLAAALAGGEGSERVYIVEPTGNFEDNPNVADKKFPGNPTRSYRSRSPLKIVGECAAWTRQTPEEIRAWRERPAHTNGEIIN